MKKYILIMFVVLLSGCGRNINEYKEVSDTVVGFFKDKSYNEEKLNDFQNDLINDYLYNLDNPEINVSDYIIYNENYKTNSPNTEGIYLKDDKCYIRYDDISFVDSSDHISEAMVKVICNGYYAILFEDSVKPLSIDYNDQKYNYRYLGYYKDSGYNFVYRSYYDGSGLIVNIDDGIEIMFDDISDLKLKTISSFSFKKYIIPCAIFFSLIMIFVYLKKKKAVE